MGHLLGGYNNKPFHLEKRPAFSKEEVLNSRGMMEPIYNGATRTRRTFVRNPLSDASPLLKSGGLTGLSPA